MIVRQYVVDGQSVKLLSKEELASDQIEFVKCSFKFTKGWDGIPFRFALFQQGDNAFEKFLDDDECTIPQELSNGFFTVSIYGTKDGTRATTVPCKDFINTSGYSANRIPAKELTPDLFAQIIQRFENAVASNGGGVGFASWSYDKANGYLHLLDKDGNDVISPLYVPGMGFDELSDEDEAALNSVLTRARRYAIDAGLAMQGAKDAEASSEEASKEAEEAASKAEDAAETANKAKERAEGIESAVAQEMALASGYADAALKQAGLASGFSEKAAESAASAKEAAAQAQQALNGFETDESFSMSGKAADAQKTGEEFQKRWVDVKVDALPETGAPNVRYYVPSEDSSDKAPLFLLYIWTDKWVQVGGSGSGSIDEEALSIVLESYFTKDEITELLENVTVDLSGYYTKEQVDKLIEDAAKSGKDLEDYYTKGEVDDLLETVPSATEVEQHGTDIEELKTQLEAVDNMK